MEPGASDFLEEVFTDDSYLPLQSPSPLQADSFTLPDVRMNNDFALISFDKHTHTHIDKVIYFNY